VQAAIAMAELSDLFRGVTLTRPSNWYIGLDQNTSGTTYTEPGYTGYARVAVSRASGSWAVGSSSLSNVAAITFPAVPTSDTLGEVANRYFLATTATPGGGELIYDFGSLTGTVLDPDVIPQLAAGAVLLLP
jgi:hypothetical protein